MERKQLKITRERKFISPEVKAFDCRTEARFLASSNSATLEDVDEINDYFGNE